MQAQNNLSEKQKEQLAQAQLLQIYGLSFLKFPIQKRMELRAKQREAIEQAYVGKPAQGEIVKPLIDPAEFKELQNPSTTKEFNKAAEVLDPAPLPISAQPFKFKINLKDIPLPEKAHKHESFSLHLTLNAKQTLAAEYAESGKSFCLTGAAGTGKTTACREIAKRLLLSGKLREHDFKQPGGQRVFAPSIAFCSFTNRATDNIRRALHKDPELETELMHNVITVHKLLEFEPVFYDLQDSKGEWYTTMRFEPQRTSKNPLKINHLVIEESSMLGTDLGGKLLDALPKDCQIIYVGDINQLPPVFGKSMLNYALILLPVIELSEVYRQALESPIIVNAHKVLKGEPLEDSRPFFQHVHGKHLKTMPTQSGVVNQLVNSLKAWFSTTECDAGSSNLGFGSCTHIRKYDPEQDIVLSPWNKGDAGTNVLNAHIAQFLGQERKAIVYEIFAGMRKLYVAVGDRVMVAKQDGYIVKIAHNGSYLGKMPKPASTELTRFGMVLIGNKDAEFEDLELSLTSYAALNVDDIPDPNEEKKQAASHIVDVKLDNGQVITLDSAGEFSEVNFSLGYALTVHKAQGCEWRKVFILMHKEHAISMNREMLYTAITRAREYCILIDLCNMAERAIENQRIMGNSIQEKIEWFNSEVSLKEPVSVIP